MRKIISVDQGSDAWFQERSGKPTASAFHKLIKSDGKERTTNPKEHQSYLWRLVVERILGRPADDPQNYKSYFAERGRKLELKAADWFETKVAAKVANIGLVLTEDERWGSSPDRLIIGTDEVLEIKCPMEWTQARYLAHPEELEDDYWPQLQGHMLVGDFQAVHLWSYHPDIPDIYRIIRRDVKFCDQLRRILNKFIKEMDKEEELARTRWFNQRGEES